jgi:sn-glycerol 3-phosphate transport system substrate-binding protein
LPAIAEIGAGGYAAKFLEEGIILPIADLARTEEDRALLADVYPALVAEATVYVDGEPVWVSWPFARSMPVLYYNPDLLREAGIEQPAATWEEFFEHIKLISDNTEAQAGYAAKIDVMTFFAPTAFSYGCELFPEDFSEASFADPECLEVLRLYQDLHAQGYWYQTREYSEPNADFANKRIGYVVASTAARPALLNSIGDAFELGTAPVPAGPAGRINSFFGSNIVIFDGAPEVQEAAWEFLKWWSAEDNSVIWSARTGYHPALRSVAESDQMNQVKATNPSVGVALEVLANAHSMPGRAAWYEIEPLLIDHLIRAITTDEDPAAVMDQAAIEANSIIAEHEQ